MLGESITCLGLVVLHIPKHITFLFALIFFIIIIIICFAFVFVFVHFFCEKFQKDKNIFLWLFFSLSFV
jgi:hypothetical protein